MRPYSTSALPLSARISVKRRTRSADLLKSHSSSDSHSAHSSASSGSRSRDVSRRRSTTCGAGSGLSRAAIGSLFYPVHRSIAELLFDIVAGITRVYGCYFPAAVKRGGQVGVDAAPVRGHIQLVVAPDHLVAQLGVEVHAVFVHQPLDCRIVAFRLDAHQLAQQHPDAFFHLGEVLHLVISLTAAFDLLDGARLIHDVVHDELAIALVVLLD